MQAQLAPNRSGSSPWRLGKKARKTVLLVHLLSAGIWIGVDVVVAVLVGAGRFAADEAARGAAYQALGQFIVAPMLVSALSCLATGVLLGLGSKYGLFRYWWVVVKLVMNVVLVVLIVLALSPGMPAVVAHGRALSAGQPSGVDVSTLFFPPIVSLTALTVAGFLAVFKPWGRISPTRPRSSRA